MIELSNMTMVAVEAHVRDFGPNQIWIDARPGAPETNAYRGYLSVGGKQLPVSSFLRQGKETILAAFIPVTTGATEANHTAFTLSIDVLRRGEDYVGELTTALANWGYVSATSLEEGVLPPNAVYFSTDEIITRTHDFCDHPL